MKRIAYLLVASTLSLTVSGGSISAQDFPATGHGSFDRGAIEIAEALTSPLPPIPGQAGAQNAVTNVPVTGVSTQTNSAPINIGTQNFGAQNFNAQNFGTQAQGQIFSSPEEIQMFAAPSSQPQLGQQQFQQQAPQFNESFAPQQYNQHPMSQPQQNISSCGCQNGCTDGSCENFVIDESQLGLPQGPVGVRNKHRLNRQIRRQGRANGLRPGRAVGQRSNGFVFSTAGASALLFDRTHGSNRDFSTNGAGDVLSSNNAVNDVLAGIDAFVARRKGNGRGWEARYFGLYPGNESIQIGGNTSNLIPGFRQLGTNISGIGQTASVVGPSADSFYDRADTHVLTRQTELNNVEFNLLKSSQPRFGANSTEFLLGFRYFQFGETLLHEALNVPNGDPTFVGPDSVGYFSSVENQLFGAQLGARSEYRLRNRLTLHVGLKAGAFNNTVNTRQRVDYRLPDGTIINPIVAGGSLSGQRFDIGNEEDVKSILGEVDVSLSLQMSNSARIRIGYRALGLTDIAFASDQVRDDFTDGSALARPLTETDLVVQGGYIGLEFAY